MDGQSAARSRRVSRDELYVLVWKTPMSRLEAEFGITGNGLAKSSGFLRVTITTYLPGKQPQWIETPEKKIAEWIPEIVGAIIRAGPILVEQLREQEDRARRYREEEARRYERQRLKEIDERRWTQFRAGAADWEERAGLLAFVAELQRRLEAEGDTKVGDRQLAEWIAWAQEKIDALDPFRRGLYGLFESIAR
jgi:hypothetical protein